MNYQGEIFAGLLKQYIYIFSLFTVFQQKYTRNTVGSQYAKYQRVSQSKQPKLTHSSANMSPTPTHFPPSSQMMSACDKSFNSIFAAVNYFEASVVKWCTYIFGCVYANNHHRILFIHQNWYKKMELYETGIRFQIDWELMSVCQKNGAPLKVVNISFEKLHRLELYCV